MIKRLTMCHVRAGEPTEIAVNHWLNDHVPLVVAVPGVRRYEQNPCVQGPTGEPAPYAGLGQVWFDTVEAALFALASWEWQAVVDDAATFMDMDRITAAWAEEYSYPSS
jgi:uncharacterized protein (TIGR02118 family)